MPVLQSRLRAVVADEGRPETFLAAPATLVATAKPALPELQEPAVELREHGIVLLVGESMPVTDFGFDPGPEGFRLERCHVVMARLRLNGRALPAPRGRCLRIVSPCCPLSGLSPGFFLCLPREAERRKRRRTMGHPLSKAPRRPLARQARLPALHRGDLLRDHRTSSPDRRAQATHVIQAAFAPPFIRRVPATQGGPLIGGGR